MVKKHEQKGIASFKLGKSFCLKWTGGKWQFEQDKHIYWMDLLVDLLLSPEGWVAKFAVSIQ